MRHEKAPPFRRASRTLSKAVHDYVHEHVNVYMGRPPDWSLTKDVVVDVHVLVDVDGFDSECLRSGQNPAPPSWGLPDTTRSAGGVLI